MRAELKIIPPRPGRTPFYYLRGTYRGTYVERSLGTTSKAVAQAALVEERRRIDRGDAAPSGPTWITAATAYLDHRPTIADCDRKFILALSLHFASMPLSKIDQAAIDRAAAVLLPEAKPATRNREVYTPISAILRHNGVSLPIKRPKGAQGTPRKNWLKSADVDKLLDAAWQVHPRFAALFTTLLYTGVRLSEALRMQIEDVHLDEGFIDVPDTKNGDPQRVHLPAVVVQAIRLALAEPGNATWDRPTQPRSTGSVFHLTKSGALYELWSRVELRAGVKLPDGVAFHLLRHTFGAWTRGAGGKLEETGRWTSRAGAKPYDHYEITDAAKIADRFPGADGHRHIRAVSG